MNQSRLREISAEMCRLLDEQSKLLNGETKVTDLSGPELDGYSRRNERLSQLSKELSELV